MLYVLLPLVAGILTRRVLANEQSIQAFCQRLKPLSVAALIATVVLLFALQAKAIAEQPLIIALIAIPLTLQTYGILRCVGWRDFAPATVHQRPPPV